MRYIEVDSCKKCGKRIEWRGIGPHKREYCSDRCRQAAFREREKERKSSGQHNVTMDTEAQARIIELEQGLALSQQNLAVYQEKLSQTNSHIQKLERQVETQRQRLGQYTSELARYRKVIDLDDRQKMIADFMLAGEEVGYKPLLSVDVRLGPHAWYAFSQTADNEHLARAIVAAKHVWKQQEDLQTTTEVAQLNKIITDLRLERTALRKQLEDCNRDNQS